MMDKTGSVSSTFLESYKYNLYKNFSKKKSLNTRLNVLSLEEQVNKVEPEAEKITYKESKNSIANISQKNINKNFFDLNKIFYIKETEIKKEISDIEKIIKKLENENTYFYEDKLKNLKLERENLQIQKKQMLLKETMKILNQDVNYYSKNLALANMLGNFVSLDI